MTRGRAHYFTTIAMIVFALLVVACGDSGKTASRHAAVFLGVAEADRRPSRTIDLVIDSSLESPASVATITETIDAVLPDMASRPTPSCIRLWTTGTTESDARLVADACVSEPTRGVKGHQEAARRYIENARPHLIDGVRAVFAMAARPRRSPIAATISRIAHARTVTDERAIIVVTDGREESDIGQFECGALPTPSRFLASLKAARALEPRSLTGVDVALVFIGFTDAKRPGCATSLRRELEIQDLWRQAFERAGAKTIRFESGAPRMDVVEVSK
jgi:hypothetical protein